MRAVSAAEQVLTRALLAGLSEIDGVRVYAGPPEHHARAGVVAFNLDGISHALVASYLDHYHDIAVRNGCFCAQPYVTRLLGLPPLARNALQAGASGFVHAEMTPDQLLRAVAVASRGELVAPRELLRYVLFEDQSGDLAALSARQREILGYVVEGLSNAEIGRRLYLSESTIKQHLRAAYKLLGVSNRTEAANLFRRGV